jgi:hypothetical protein
MKYQITLLLSTFISLIQSEVLFVLEHFRHGATGPSELDKYGKDLMKNTWDETEVDELTPIGIRMQYILGLYFADRYKHLIPDKYDPKAIYVSSVNDSKAIQSAIAHTSAFYFGKGDELNDQTKERAKPPVNNLNETIIESLGYEALPGNFQTIPIHIFHPYEHDFLLQEENGDCKAVKEIRESNLKTEVFKKIKEKFENEILSLWENSEIIINKKASTFEKIKLICENFFVNDANNNSFTSLKERAFNNNETKFNDFKSSCNEALSAKLFNYIFNPEQIYFTYVTQSKQMRKMLDYMDKRRDQFINQKEDDIDYTKPKIVIWSGLDSTVAGTQMFFNELHKVLNKMTSDKNYTDKNYTDKNYTDNIIIYPTYASSIFIELNWNENYTSNCSIEQMHNTTNLDDNDSCFYVQYFINGISYANYTYYNFKQAFGRIVVDDDVVDNYCNFKLGTKNNGVFLIVCIVFVVIILIGSVCSSTYFYNGIRKNENKKSFVGPLHAV